jgi:rsbT co-antagonist protein RsbR
MLTGLTRKVTLAALVFLTLIALVAAVVLLSIASMQEATTLLTGELLPQLDAKGDYTTSMARMLGELEAFTQARAADDLTKAQQSILDAQDAVARLSVEASDGDEGENPEDIAANQRLLERESALLQAGQRLVADAATPNAVLGPETVAAIDQLHTDLAELEDDRDALLARQSTNVTALLAANVQSLFISAGALVVLCVALVLIALFLLRRVIVQPIIRLSDAAQDVAGGRLDQTVSVSSGDEIGALQRSFNTMVTTLQQQREDLRREAETAEAARAAAEASAAEVTAQLQTIEEQRSVIRETSVPILPLSRTAFVMPLIGTMDTARLQIAQQRALQAMERTAVAHVVLDVTGVPLIDSQVGRGLLDIIGAARLLGTQVVLVGIRPEVAQTLVQLGIQFDHVVVRGTLQDGITHVLRQH